MAVITSESKIQQNLSTPIGFETLRVDDAKRSDRRSNFLKTPVEMFAVDVTDGNPTKRHRFNSLKSLLSKLHVESANVERSHWSQNTHRRKFSIRFNLIRFLLNQTNSTILFGTKLLIQIRFKDIGTTITNLVDHKRHLQNSQNNQATTLVVIDLRPEPFVV